VVGPSAKRNVLEYLEDSYDVSRRKACETISLSRSTAYRKPKKDDSEVEGKLKELAQKYPTRGVDWYYSRIRLEGLKWNRKRVLRVYRKMGLAMRRKFKKRINRPYEEGLSQPILPNVCWSMDFMSDALEDGRKVRIFNVIDDYNRACLSNECGISMPSQRVTRILEQIIELRGKPESIRTDNGPEFTSHHFTDWCKEKNIKTKYIQPGKPHQNGYIERFNRTFREDVLDAYIFEKLSQLRIISQKWQDEYNYGHPHQSLGGLTPIGFEISRRKGIEASEIVKAKMNGSPHVEPALTNSSTSNWLR
jgi:putative transposase